MSNPVDRTGSWKMTIAVLSGAVVLFQSALAQTFDDGLMDRVRSASHMIPGESPIDVRFQSFFEFRSPLSAWYEDGSSEIVNNVTAYFRLDSVMVGS